LLKFCQKWRQWLLFAFLHFLGTYFHSYTLRTHWCLSKNQVPIFSTMLYKKKLKWKNLFVQLRKKDLSKLTSVIVIGIFLHLLATCFHSYTLPTHRCLNKNQMPMFFLLFYRSSNKKNACRSSLSVINYLNCKWFGRHDICYFLLHYAWNDFYPPPTSKKQKWSFKLLYTYFLQY
jgi:hypothetical protein